MSVGIPRFWSGFLTGADIQNKSLGGTDLTDNASAKVLVVSLPDTGTIGSIPTAAASVVIATVRAPCTGQLAGVAFWTSAVVTGSNTNFVTFDIMDLGQLGVGTTALLATTPTRVNSTQLSPGSGTMVANQVYVMTPIPAAPVAAGDVLQIRGTVSGTLPAILTASHVSLGFLPVG